MPPKKKSSVETNDQMMVTNNGIEPKKSASKPGPKKGQKRKYTIVTPVKQRSLFTLHEKKQFLKALKEEGFNVINTPEVLTKYITDRPVSEIRQMIALYTRKSEEQQRKDGEYSTEDSPIESWNSVFQGLLSSTVRKSDYSLSSIPQILQEIGEEYALNASDCDNSTDSVNYGEIYKYLAEVMCGNYPPELKRKDAAAIIVMMKAMQHCLDRVSTEEETKFLSGGSWWSSGDETVAESNDGSGPSTSVNSNETVSHESNAPQNSTDSDSNGTENIEVYLNLPKIKKISDCMNPLKVPVSLLKDLQQRVSAVLSLLELSAAAQSKTIIERVDEANLAIEYPNS